jgi:hypothetical protein
VADQAAVGCAIAHHREVRETALSSVTGQSFPTNGVK